MTSVLAAARPDLAPPPAPGRRWYVGWLPAATTLLFLAVVLLLLGTSAWDILRYAGYALWGALIPGTPLYRVLRGRPHSLVDDLAMGGAVGLSLEIGAWAVYSAAGAQSWLWTWPAAVVVPFLAVPRLRRHWWVRGLPRAPLGWSWGMAGVTVFYLSYLALAALRPFPPYPHGRRYYIVDLQYMLSMVGEAKHHFALRAPGVAGEPLDYHWFAYAHEASASLVSGVDTPVVFFRLALPVMSMLAVLLLGVAGWRISGRPWVGVVAAALTFVVGETVAGDLSDSLFGTSTAFVWTSHSQDYSWIFTTALFVVVAAAFKDKLTVRGTVLLAILSFAVAGAKSTVLQLLLAGIVLAAAVELLRRRRISRLMLVVGAVFAVADLFAIVVLFRFKDHGVSLHPFLLFHSRLTVYHTEWKKVVVLAWLCLGYALYMLPRLAGIPVLARLRRREWGPVHWFLLGVIGSAVGGTLLLGHPSGSQLYFLRSGWQAGALLSAMGLVALVEARGASWRTIAAVAGLTAAGAGVVDLALWTTVAARPGQPGYRWAIPIFSMALAMAALIGAGALVWRALARRRPGLAGAGAVALLTAVLCAGSATLVADAYQYSVVEAKKVHGWDDPVTGDYLAAARWLRAHTSADDVLATNQHYPRNGIGCPLTFWLPAYAERRVYLGAWAYTPRAVGEAGVRGINPCSVPYWDQAQLAANDAVFYAPTAAGVDRMRTADGVSWLVVNRDIRPESPELAGLAKLRETFGPIAIYQLG